MVKRSPLDDGDTSKVAWARYRRLMKGMALVSLIAVVERRAFDHARFHEPSRRCGQAPSRRAGAFRSPSESC